MATEVGALPDDALAAVFLALSPRSLAVVRCVCKPRRDVIDARALLLQHLHHLPLTVRGVFINYEDHAHPHHLARPCSPSATMPKADGTLSFLPQDLHRRLSILDHCNGLLLCGKAGLGLGELCVCNPATRRWTVLPRWWRMDDYKRHHRYAGAYIAFDPAESPHYQVVLVPAVPPESYDDPYDRRRLQLEKEKDAPFCLDWFFSLPEPEDGQWEFGQGHNDVNDYVDLRGYMEWPPAPWTMRVFSSSTGRWEDKAFVREGLPAGTVAKMRLDKGFHYKPRLRYGVYHHGSLYMYCRGSFLTRISLTKSKYQVIGAPSNVNQDIKAYYLGKLHNGVCFGIVHYHELKIWILNEACGQMEWVLKYETVVGHYNKYLESIASGGRRHDGPWTREENNTDHDAEYLSEQENIQIQDADYDYESLSEEETSETQDTDYDDESLQEEENIEMRDTDYDDESLSTEENIAIQDTDNDDKSLSEEENIENQVTNHDHHDLESLPDDQNIKIQDTNHDVESLSKEDYKLDSDNDDTFIINIESQEYFDNYWDLNIIGFHPYKEVVFMVQQSQVVAYHLNSTKLHYLGNSHPKHCHRHICCNQHKYWSSFLYTPCMIGDLLYGNQPGGPSSSLD